MKTDSKILAADFEYLHCKTQAEALDYLAEHGGSAKILAGGTDLLVKMKTGALQCDRLISIQQIASLNYLRDSAASFKIGAVTTLREVEANPQVKLHYSALFEALRSMAATSVRNMGTIGGNLCNGSPAADTAPPRTAPPHRKRHGPPRTPHPAAPQEPKGGPPGRGPPPRTS